MNIDEIRAYIDNCSSHGLGTESASSIFFKLETLLCLYDKLKAQTINDYSILVVPKNTTLDDNTLNFILRTLIDYPVTVKPELVFVSVLGFSAVRTFCIAASAEYAEIDCSKQKALFTYGLTLDKQELLLKLFKGINDASDKAKLV